MCPCKNKPLKFSWKMDRLHYTGQATFAMNKNGLNFDRFCFCFLFFCFFVFIFLRNFFCSHPENHAVMRGWEWGEKILMQGRMTAKKIVQRRSEEKNNICRANYIVYFFYLPHHTYNLKNKKRERIDLTMAKRPKGLIAGLTNSHCRAYKLYPPECSLHKSSNICNERNGLYFDRFLFFSFFIFEEFVL